MKAQVNTCSYSAAERSQDRSLCMPLRMSTCTTLAMITQDSQSLQSAAISKGAVCCHRMQSYRCLCNPAPSYTLTRRVTMLPCCAVAWRTASHSSLCRQQQQQALATPQGAQSHLPAFREVEVGGQGIVHCLQKGLWVWRGEHPPRPHVPLICSSTLIVTARPDSLLDPAFPTSCFAVTCSLRSTGKCRLQIWLTTASS